MSDIEDFANWIVKNQALKGTPDFETVAKAFTELEAAQRAPVAPAAPPDTGFTGAFKGAYQGIKGEAALTAGKLGLMSLDNAQQYYEEQKKKQAEVFQPTTEGWGTAPWQKFKETLGGSLPYMVAPVVGAVAGAVAAPELAVVGLGAATLGSLAGGTAQFTGTGLARQMETGKNLEETNLGYAVGAAIPSAALDTISLRMTPFLGQLFRKAGIEVSEKETQEIVKKNLLSTVGEYAAQGVKLAGIEGATEAGQAVFERLQAGLSLTDKSAVDEYIENFIGGAVLGGALGTAGHAASKAFAPKAGEAIVAPSAIAPEAPVAPLVEEPVAEPVATTPEEAPAATEEAPVAETAVETPVAAKAEVFTVEDPVAKAGIHKEFGTLEAAEAHVDNLAANRAELIAEHQSNVDATNADIATLQKGLDTEVAKGNYGTPQFLTHENNINNEIGALTTKAVQEQALIDNLSQPVQIVSPTNAVVEVKAVQATPIAPTPITPAPAPLQAVTEPVAKVAQVSYAPDLAGKMATLQKTLLPTLKKFGLDKVGLRIVDSIANGQADASYVNQIMKIAYDTKDHMGALRHESIHALKELGAFADNEWKVLSNKAKTEWIDRFIRQPNLYTGYQEQYEANNGSLDGFDAYMQEEAIAEAFRHFAKTKPPAGLVGQLYSRLNNMFESVGNSFKSLGYTNAEAIFQKIERGEAKPKKVEKKVEKVAEKIAEKPVKVKKAPEAKKVAPAQGRYQEWLDKVATRMAKEGAAQEILDDMEENNVSVNGVTKTFWDKTYFNLPAQAQKIFRKNLAEHSGAGNNIDGDINSQVKNLDLPNEVQDLQGTERGFVALMFEANRRFAPEETTKIEKAPKALKAPEVAEKKAEPKIEKAPEVKAPVKVKKSELEAIWNEYRHTALPFSSLSKEDIQVLARVKDKDGEVIDRAVQKIYKAIEQAPTEAEVEAVAAQEIDTKEVAQEEEEAQPEEEEEPQAPKIDKAAIKAQKALDKAADKAQKVLDKAADKIEAKALKLRIKEAVKQAKRDIDNSEVGQALQRVQDENFDMDDKKDIRSFYKKLVKHEILEEGGDTQEYLSDRESEASDVLYAIENELQDAYDNALQERIDEVTEEAEYQTDEAPVANQSNPQSVAESLLTKEDTALLEKIGVTQEEIADKAMEILGQAKNVHNIRANAWAKQFGDLAAQVQALLRRIMNGMMSVVVGINLSVSPPAIQPNTSIYTYTTPIHVANFKGAEHTEGVQRLANAILDSKKNDGMAFVIADKASATMYVFDENGNLKGSSPVLLGAAKGDKNLKMSMSAVENNPVFKTTPSGIFTTTTYKNEQNKNEYGYEWSVQLNETLAKDNSAVAIHAVYLHTPSEQRQTRLDTKSIEDNRVSYGCLNAPLKFMQDVVKPTFENENGKVFITPEEMGSDDMLGLPAAKTKTVKKLTQSLETESGRLQTSKQEDILATEDSGVKYKLREERTQPVIRTEKFRRWFGKSEIVNKDGTPKVMYHGTARDITEFRAKQAGAIFLTDDPDFAESFSDDSEQYMIDEALGYMSEAEHTVFISKAEAISQKQGTDTLDELRELIKDSLPTKANIMPVYVSAQNVFDYDNPAHLDALQEAGISAHDIKRIKTGAWSLIETKAVQAAIKKAGFDGFYVSEGGKKNLAVYTSNQIKSAIGNNGEFDINNPDIRYKLRTPAAPVTDAPPQQLTKLTPAQTVGRQIKDAAVEVQTAWHSNDFWTNLRQTWVDPSSALAQSLSGKGAWDLKGLRADMLHRAKSQIINVINNGLQIGTAKLNKDGSIIIERSENNLARSQILADKLDANPFVQATGLSGRKFVSEIARALRGEEIIADDTKRKAQAVKDLAEARKMFKDSKDLPYKEKAKVRREAANLRKQAIENKNINRELQVTPEQIAWAKKQLQAVPEVEDVFDIWRNVNNSLLDLWHDTGLLKKTQVDEYRSKKRYVPMFASKEDLNEQMFGALGFSGAKSVKDIQRLRGSELDRNIWENMYKNYATKISAAYENQTRRVAVSQLVEVGAAEISTATDKRVNLRFKDYNHPDADANGVVHAVVYNTNDVLAFQNMHYELTPLMKGFSKMTNILRTGALLNPMFWIRQLIRDPIHAAIVTDSGIVTPFHAAKEFINILKNDSREFSILFERGVVGPRDSTLDYHDYLTQIGQEKADTSTFRNALHKIEMMHEASDAATRVSIFKDAEAKALKQGMSAEDAINFAVYKSRESINFSVHGNGKMLNNIRHMIPFFSASITSLDTVYRAATGYGLPPAEKAAAQKMFKQRAGAMLVMSAAYAMMMQGDDEYEKLPDHVKDGNWLVPNPLGTGFIKIAVPFEVGFLFKTIPETAVRYMAGTSTGKEVLASYQAGILQNMPGNLVPLPQAVRPLFEVITNYSFFTGETIETAGDSHLPTAFRGANASELAKVLSKFGLDSIGLSPTKIDYLTQGFMAELGITGMALASQAVLAAEGKTSPDTNLEKLPFFKAFMTDPNADKAVSDFYKIEQNAVKVHTEFQKMLKSGMGKEAIEYLKEGNNQKIIAYEPSLIKMSKQLGTIRAAINVTTNNQSMSPEDRRLQINNLKKVYNNVADAYAKVAKSID